MNLFDTGPGVAIATLVGAAVVVIAAIFYFVQSAPPSSITISTGMEGSSFQKNAIKYAAILEKNGVKVKVLTSEGSAENLKRLEDPNSHVDVGMVQDGMQAPISLCRWVASPTNPCSFFIVGSMWISCLISKVRRFRLVLLEAARGRLH